MGVTFTDAKKRNSIKRIQTEFSVNRIYAQVVFEQADKEDLFTDAARIIGEKPRPFVKWVGGKRQLLQQFKDLGLYPPDGFDPKLNSYFEPFVGGGAVFFDLLPHRAYLSDMNRELVVTYNIIKNNVESLINSLSKHKYEKEYYLQLRAKDIASLSDLEIASRFIYLNKTGFNGLYRVNKSGKFNVPFGSYTNPTICDADNLRKVASALHNTTIAHQDYRQATRSAKRGDFVYFDPPYFPVSKTASFTSYTNDEFLEKQQIELRDEYLRLHKKGCFVMLSNSDTPFIRKIYAEVSKYGIRVHKIQASRTINSKASRRGKISEVLVTNY